MTSNYDRRDILFRDQFLLPWSPARTISTRKAADLLHVSDTTIRSMIEDGTLKGYKIRPKAKCSPYRVSRESVEEHMRKIRIDLDMPCETGSANGTKSR